MKALTKINPDLQEERDKVSFDVEEFTNWFYKGEEKVEEKRFLGTINQFVKVQMKAGSTKKIINGISFFYYNL